jgi:hypothetical protein
MEHPQNPNIKIERTGRLMLGLPAVQHPMF